MSAGAGVGLPEALERAAVALPADAEAIRPANGDPARLLELLDAERAAHVLGWLLANQPEDGAELAAAWAEDPEVGAAVVLRVPDQGLGKEGRKALRRARHALRSRGLEVPEAEPTPVVAKLPPLDDSLNEALISPVDPRGTLAAYLVASHPSGGARLFELLLDEDRGVLECRVYSAGRSKVRRFLRDFQQRDRFAAVPASPAAVRALVKRIAAAQPSERPLPRAFNEWRSQLTGVDEGTATPGQSARAELGGGEASPPQLERVIELVRAGEVGPWPAAPELLQPLAERIGEVAQGKIIVSGARRREQADRVIEEALAQVFGGPFGARTAARFEETAYVFWKRDRTDDARACLAAADGFRAGSPGENPVARAMLEVVLAPVLQKLEEETQAEEKDSRLIET